MVSGKPPRRSQSANEPVTIDLSAEEEAARLTADEMRDIDATVSDDVIPEPSKTASPAEAAADAPFATGSSPADPLPAEEPWKAAAPVAAPAPKTSSAPILLAGIVGGLVALAAAGAMQYAGVLPGVSPQTAASGDTSLSADVAALRAEVAQLSATTPAGTDPAIIQRLGSVESSIQKMAGSSAAVDSAVLEQMQAELAQANTTIAALKSDIAGNAQSISDSETRISERLSEAEKKIDAPREDIEVARAIAVTALKSAVDRGGPFLTELETLAGVAPDDAALAGLREFAAVGVPTRAELVRQFPDVADAILAAIRQPLADDGVVNRLLSSALSVVKVRPVGNAQGDTPEAIIARIEDKLRNGDMKGAVLEWNNLPDAGKSASAEFEKTLQARIKAEELVGAAAARSLAADKG